MQRIDHASAAALKRGSVLSVHYADGFRHRLLIEEPLPVMPSAWQGAAFRYEMRHPVDVYPASSVLDAEKLLAQQAKQHGDWTLQCQQAEEAR